MANVTRYDPFDMVEGMVKSVLPPFMEQMMGRMGNRQMADIPIDLCEDERSYTLWAELPGVKKEDLSVSVTGSQVSISAEVRRENAQAEEHLLLNERWHGQLFRIVQLPAEIDDAKAEAKYRDGVLEIKLPKKSAWQLKRLAVH
jgi:HSP20 family protein